MADAIADLLAHTIVGETYDPRELRSRLAKGKDLGSYMSACLHLIRCGTFTQGENYTYRREVDTSES